MLCVYIITSDLCVVWGESGEKEWERGGKECVKTPKCSMGKYRTTAVKDTSDLIYKSGCVKGCQKYINDSYKRTKRMNHGNL
jgi:hypothetical protein